VEARKRPEIQLRVSLRHVSEAEALIDSARGFLEAGATEDAHQTLRVSSQHALTASMMRHGWTLRGAKKRPEIASSFLPDEEVRSALGLVLEVVGLRELSKDKASRYCDIRMEIRSMLVAELQRLASKFEGARETLSQVREHERNAVDYYDSMVRSCKVHGPINHIRCLSGFPTIPNRLLDSADITSTTPISDFLKSDFISAEMKEKWADLAGLESEATRIKSWLSRAEEINRCLRETCEESFYG